MICFETFSSQPLLIVRRFWCRSRPAGPIVDSRCFSTSVSPSPVCLLGSLACGDAGVQQTKQTQIFWTGIVRSWSLLGVLRTSREQVFFFLEVGWYSFDLSFLEKEVYEFLFVAPIVVSNRVSRRAVDCIVSKHWKQNGWSIRDRSAIA